MLFTFKEKESLLYNLCLFPKLLYITEADFSRLNEVLEDQLTDTFVHHEAYVAFVKAAQSDLEPYKDPLLGFYADEAISNYDFPMLLFRTYSFFGYDTYRDYLNAIMDDDEATLQKNLIHALLTVEQTETGLSDADAAIEADTIRTDREKLMQLIRSTPTTENHRWILMLLIDSPKAYLEVYRDLLDTIKPIFDKHFADHHDRFTHYKETVVKPLETEGLDAFTTLTQGMVPADVIETDLPFITSIVEPYRFSILRFGPDKCILFGLEMQTGFARIAEFEQDSRKNRAKVFKTLSDETRYEVLRLLARGMTSTKEIANTLGVSSATITYHINAFLTAKVIRVDKAKQAKYLIDFDRLNTLWHDFLDDLKPDNV
ncbi:MAG: ArsR family transcriptional regulator [Acholeplasmatales bacterium]|nr:MAG: ArsR family transcriptional regulator [Acholeplasmatales bacterium]